MREDLHVILNLKDITQFFNNFLQRNPNLQQVIYSIPKTHHHQTSSCLCVFQFNIERLISPKRKLNIIILKNVRLQKSRKDDEDSGKIISLTGGLFFVTEKLG